MKRVLVWDIPTRVFHWLLAASFVGAWLSRETDRWLSVHVFFGCLMLGLIGFRLVWGLVGGHYARFRSFLYSPLSGLAYLRRMMAKTAPRHLGHNPAGSQAIYGVLALGVVVGFAGVFTMGAEEGQGAAARVMSIEVGGVLKDVHEIAARLMLCLVIGHLVGVAVESGLHRENLPRAMVTGRKEAPADTVASKPHRVAGSLLLAAVAVFAAWWFFYALPAPLALHLGVDLGKQAMPRVAFVGKELPDDPRWREECGSCHLPYHPSLLPVRSWHRLMADQAQHFGVDLALDAPVSEALLGFMTANAAEHGRTEAAFKINQSIPPEVTPLRITETPYWTKKHQEIATADWQSPSIKSKANCAACHQDAEAGTFEDAAMAIPR